jgi:hypothetical protein
MPLKYTTDKKKMLDLDRFMPAQLIADVLMKTSVLLLLGIQLTDWV